MLVGPAIPDGMTPMLCIFPKSSQVAYTPPQKSVDTARPAYSFKSLAQVWGLRIPSSLKSPLTLDTLWHACSSRHDFLPAKNSLSATFTLVFCQSSEQRVVLIVLYIVENKGIFSLAGSVRIQASYSSSENCPLRLTFWDSKPPFHSLLHWCTLRVIFFLPLGSVEFPHGSRSQNIPNLVHYHPCRKIKSLFGFLKYSGPRRLPASRKILLDQDGYQITHIGRGAFAVISRVLHRPSGEVRAMKRITFDNSGLAEYLAKNEVDTLKAMAGSIWFPPLLNDFAEGGEFVVTMPFYRRGDLAGFLEHKRHLGREVAQFYSAQLVLAIQSLHKVGIIHRDIKPDNIFLDEEGHLVLADLGLAENIAVVEGGESVLFKYPAWLEARATGGDNFPFLWVNEHNPLGTRGAAGTFWYTAPEVFRQERYSFGVDYWSVGVVYHELITGHIPFNHYKPYPEDKRPALDFRTKPGQLKDIEPWEQRALSDILAPYTAGRPKTLKDIKASRIFDGVDWIKMSRKHIPPPSLPPPLQEG